MSKRLLLFIVLDCFVILGLASGVFANSLQRALTAPAPQTTKQQPAAIVATAPAGTMQAQAGNNVLAEDTFQRPNQALWGTASDGRQWDGDANTSAAFSIVKGTGQITQMQAAHLNAILGPTATDVDVSATGVVSRFDDGVSLAVVAHWTDGNNWYKAFIDGRHLVLRRNHNGQTKDLGAVEMQAFGGVPHTIRVKMIGTMIFVKEWRSDVQKEPAQWQITVNDTDRQQFLPSGRSGLRVSVGPGTGITIMSFKATVATMGNTI